MDEAELALAPEERLEPINEQLRLIRRTGGLTFGTDSFLLGAFLRDGRNGRGCELGSGTGVVSLLAAQRRAFRSILALEIQPSYAELTERNARLNGLDSVITARCADVRNVLPSEVGTFRAVWSNPPYLPVGGGAGAAEPEMDAARRERNGTLGDFAAAASRLLDCGGTFSLVYRPDRLVTLLTELRAHRLEPKRMITVYPDVNSRPCLLLLEAVKDGAPGLTQARPLLIYRDGCRSYTEDMQRVYDGFSLSFLF